MAYLNSPSNFLLENVYFDYDRVSNKKVNQLKIFEDIPHSLLQRSMWKWVVHWVKVGILETKPTDTDLVSISNIAELFSCKSRPKACL